jgi:hypothetical protein
MEKEQEQDLTYLQRKKLYIVSFQTKKYNTCPEYHKKQNEASKISNKKRYTENPEYRAKKQEANRIYQTNLRAAKKKLNELKV